MCMKKVVNFSVVAITALAGLLLLGACSKENAKNGNAAKGSGTEVRKVLVGIRQDMFPTSFIDEKGRPTGYDIEVFQKIDELYPEYEFSYEAVSQETLLLGTEANKYQVAAAGFFRNSDREARFLFPEENIGGNLIGLVTLSNVEGVKTLQDVSARKFRLVPFSAITGIYALARSYNDTHPNEQVKIEVSEWQDTAAGYRWILEGRYDAYMALKEGYNAVAKELDLDGKLKFNEPFWAIQTWSLFNKNETELAAAFDKAVRQFKEDGTLSQISIKWYGGDVHAYDY
jgi:L-cystine transport system substrate-binding protein